ncbi:hypothetical protein E3U43_006456 [Larimichthys crocea]|uniref:Uncharacterized protein n=1 Tax=Larimichthys crocea TaxID=215358 RepID=A0ACD3RKH6_LARCR|nr:hypothetical protein E3U43_006456 [Larimichthys crocea]
MSTRGANGHGTIFPISLCGIAYKKPLHAPPVLVPPLLLRPADRSSIKMKVAVRRSKMMKTSEHHQTLCWSWGKSRDTKQPLELKVHLHWVDFTLGNTQSRNETALQSQRPSEGFSPSIHRTKWQYMKRCLASGSKKGPCEGLNWGCDVPEHKMAHEHGVLHSAVCLNLRDELN